MPGFVSPVVGFELASDARARLRHPRASREPGAPAAVAGMNRGNRIDFLFMIAYPALYVGIVLLLRARGRLSAGLGRFLLLLPS